MINPDEAELVRYIFGRYLELGSVNLLAAELESRGIRSKRWTTKSGNVRGGVVLARGALLHILRNRLYLGEVPHKETSHPGQHPPIVETELFDAVQARLNQSVRKARPGAKPRTSLNAPLTGLIYDAGGNRMSPVQARSGSRTYRYYVSTALQTGAAHKAGPNPRVPAAAIEQIVRDGLIELGLPEISNEAADWSVMRDLLFSVTVEADSVAIALNSEALDAAAKAAPAKAQMLVARLDRSGDRPVLHRPLSLVRRGGQVLSIGPLGMAAQQATGVDPALSAALIRAESWKRQLLRGEAKSVEAIGAAEGIRAAYVAKVIRVAFLAPDLKKAILDGCQPAGLTLQTIVTGDLPLSWDEQRASYAA